MSEFNPSKTVKDLSDAASKAAELSEKWSKSTANKSALKQFVGDNTKFFKSASTVMGVLSAGCTAADALGLFGKSDQQKVMDSLATIETKIDKLSETMINQFASLSVQVDYVVANATLDKPRAEIMSAITKANLYINAARRGDKNLTPYINPVIAIGDLATDVQQFYNSFMSGDNSGNILNATYNYFGGAPGPLISKGYDIMYLVHAAAKVMGLKERLVQEKNKGAALTKSELEDCMQFINDYYREGYESMVDKMNEKLEAKINEALDNTESNIARCFDLRVKGMLVKNPTGDSNPTVICKQMEVFFPMIYFMSVEYNPCSGNDAHVDGLRASRALKFYPFSSTNRNLHIWWQWCPEPEGYNLTLSDKAIAIRNNQMTLLESMDECLTSRDTIDSISYTKRDYDLNNLIKKAVKNDLYHYSAGANALVIRKSKANKIDWSHSNNAFPMAISKGDEPKRFYHVFWMMLDF